jgi:hypothetical protein
MSVNWEQNRPGNCGADGSLQSLFGYLLYESGNAKLRQQILSPSLRAKHPKDAKT